jgi:Ca2+-binding RTX toxin-like protein
VTEIAGGGTDLVQSSISYTLGAEVENLTLTGSSAINATGNTVANVLTETRAITSSMAAPAATRCAVGWATTPTSSRWPRTWLQRTPAKAPTSCKARSRSRSRPTSKTSRLTGTSTINGTGNTLANTLIGNTADNNTQRGTGNDTLQRRLAGNDTYVVDVATDIVTELANEGTDVVADWALLHARRQRREPHAHGRSRSQRYRQHAE